MRISAIVMDPRRLLTDQWKTVERLIDRTCRRCRLEGADADELASMVKVKLWENDCELVRRFRGDSKFSTYLNTIVQNTLGDLSVKRRGKWHPSAAATRLGDVGLELEKMVYRDGWAPEEAIASLLTTHPQVSRSELDAMLAIIPRRYRQRSTVPIDVIADSLCAAQGADILVERSDRRKMSLRAAAIVREYLAGLAPVDRLLLQLHFETNMKLSDISRVLQVEQKPLYRRRSQLLRDLRAKMESARITASEVADLIGHITDDSDFGLRKAAGCPSETDGGVPVQTEIP